MSFPIEKSDEQWRSELSPLQFQVLRQKGTERPFTGEFDDHFAQGTYHCAACDAELFSGEAKFHSGCGWPAFYQAVESGSVLENSDYSHGMVRTEVVCATCGSHLGHVFGDAPKMPTGLRYCINSVCLRFVPASE